ncbi:hypothetical protein INT46_006641, partial [Mucor plumbeus]
MRKLFGANKKKKSNNLKTSTLKIPIPMINGVEYADLTESHISTLIGGGNKGYYKKKLATSLSSQRTNNTIPNEKTPSNIPVQHQPVTPSRSISSPPILVMPKPMHSLPPTRYLLGNYDYEKTQVESSVSSSDEEEEEQIMSSPLPLTTTEKEVDEENNNYQSSTYVTRTSDDSMRQYISASESPFITASSVVSSMNHQNNIDGPFFPPFSSPSSPSFVKYTPTGNDMNNIGNNASRLVTCSSVPPPSTSTVTAAVADSNNMQEIPKPPSINSNEAVIQEFPLPPSNVYSTEDTNRNLPPISEYNNISTTPISIPTKKRVSRPPTSSSGSSATVGHDVTHSQSRFVNNNSGKPPGTLLQPISSESSAFNQNNNNNRMDSLTEMLQSEIKKMALNEDLIELKRTVDRMQQQRVSDLEDHLTRVAEQKLREKEILEQIKLTKQRLDMAIAERMFTNNNKEEEETDQRLPKQTADAKVPLMKSSNSTNTTRSNKLKPNAFVSGGAASSSGNNNNSSRQLQQQQQQQQQPQANRQRNRRSFPSAYQRLPAQNEYFPDMSKPNFDFNYPSQYGYSQDYNPDIDMMRMLNGNQNHFANPFGMDSPRLRYSRRKSSLQRRPRSKSMESQWQEQQEQENQYIQQHHQHPDMYQDGDLYYPTPRIRSRKSSLHSAKSSSSDSDNNNNNKRSDLHDNFDQLPTTNEDEKRSASGKQPEMGSDEDRHHSVRHRNGSGRFRRGHPHPGNMGNMPPNMFVYPNGPPPLPHPMDREHMKMRPPPPPPPYGYNNMPPPPPPPGNEYFSYMPPSQRISPRMMAALAADEQNQQQQQQPYGGYQWGQGMYGIPPPPPPDNAGTGANCEQQDQPAFGRRFPPPPPTAAGGQQQSASLQQTPQPPPPPPQGYISMY